MKNISFLPKFLSVSVVFLCSMIFTAGIPRAEESKSASAYERVISSGVIRCGYGVSPPSLMKDPNTGALSGVDYEVWQEIGKDLNLKIEWAEEAGWGNFIEGLKAHRYDAFCSQLWPDAGRTKFLSLSLPMTYTLVNAYVRADDHRFDGNLERTNQSDITIPAIEGDISVEMAQKGFPNAKVLALSQTATVSDMLMSLLSKKTDIIFLSQSLFEGAIAPHNKGKIIQVPDVPASFIFPSHYGFNSGEVQLRDMVNVVLQKMIDDGRLKKIALKYGSDYKIPRPNFVE